jgi:site-specific DNA-methyltransferase (adenine-specific)
MRVETIGNARLYLGRCEDVLPTLSGIDAVVCDPPYGINIRARVNFPDRATWDTGVVDLAPVLSIGRFHVVWGGQYYTDQLPVSEGWAIWVKRPVRGIEKAQTHTTIEMAWSNFGKPRFLTHVWDGGLRAGHPDNRLFCHPAQKPIEVMEWCIEDLPDGSRTILDPYMGSGTTGCAAARLGRSFVGIERDPVHYETAVRRITEAQRQSDLFLPPSPPQAVQAGLFAESER